MIGKICCVVFMIIKLSIIMITILHIQQPCNLNKNFGHHMNNGCDLRRHIGVGHYGQGCYFLTQFHQDNL